MERAVIDFFNTLINQNDAVLYIVLFLSAVVENIFPPIPGDTITALGAFLVATGKLNYWLVYLATTLGSVTGFMFLFCIARRLGREFFRKKNYSFMSIEKIDEAEIKYGKLGYVIILINRFFPGLRSVISVSAGILNLNTLKVMILSLISASVWNIIWIHTGFLLGNNWNIVQKKFAGIIGNYNKITGIVLIAAIVIYAAYRLIKRRKNNSAAS